MKPALLILVLALSGCVSTRRNVPQTVGPSNGPYQAPRGKYLSRLMTLYSVDVQTQGWRFLLMPEEFSPQGAGSYANLYRVDELPKAFRALPDKALVMWRNDDYNAWTFPPQPLLQKVRQMAKAEGVELNPISSIVDR